MLLPCCGDGCVERFVKCNVTKDVEFMGSWCVEHEAFLVVVKPDKYSMDASLHLFACRAGLCCPFPGDDGASKYSEIPTAGLSCCEEIVGCHQVAVCVQQPLYR